MASFRPIEGKEFNSGREWLEFLAALPIKERREILDQKGEVNMEEAALYVGRSKKTLYNLIAMNQGPRREVIGQSATGFGGRYRFKTADLRAWDQERTVRKDAYSR